jgi:hypothetical protein
MKKGDERNEKEGARRKRMKGGEREYEKGR